MTPADVIDVKETSPPAVPALEPVAVPPLVVISPLISIVPVVAPEPGFLISALIVTAPPAVSSLPVVTIVAVAF